MRRLTIFLALFLAALTSGMSCADEAPMSVDQINARLDRAHATLDETQKSLEDPHLTDGTLRQLRDRMDVLSQDLEEVVDTLSPRLAAVEARLKELAPTEAKPPEPPAQTKQAPAPTPPSAETKATPAPPMRPASLKPESKPDAGGEQPPPSAKQAASGSAEASIDADIAVQRDAYGAIDATLKRARALLLETRQVAVAIVARQRALFAKTLFLRTSSLFSVDLWRAAIDNAPTVFSAARSFLADRAANFVGRTEGHRGQLAAVVAAILLTLPPALILSRRVLRRNREGKKPTPTMRAAAAGWTALVVSAAPITAAAALGAAFEAFDLLDATLEPLWRRIFEAIARIAFVYGAARAVFAPTHPEWRVIDLGDRRDRLFVVLFSIGALTLSGTLLVEQIEETVQASLPLVIVTRGVGVMIHAALLLWGLTAIAPREGEAATGKEREWLIAARLAGFLMLAVILGACVAGYVTFANFVVLHASWIATIGFTLYVVVVLSTGRVEHAFSGDGLLGRGLTSALGVKQEQLAPIGVLLSGIVTLVVWSAGALLAVTPFGYSSNDILGNLWNSFVSYKIGDVTVSPSAALTAIVLFLLVLAATQGLRRWLDTRLLPLTRLDASLRSSINATLGYAGVIAAVMTALSSLGIGVEKLAIVAGALSVGIGFGLQSIVSNFVSGLILLWERVIRVGDWVVIGDEQGYVRRINVRSTEIETFDRATMVVPNSNLVTGVVKNWLRGDRVGRIKVAISPHPGVDPEQIRDIMIAAARAQEGLLRIPAPQVMFLGMEATAFKFELWCYVEDVEKSARVRSDLHFDLYRRLSEAGIKMAPVAEPPKTILQLPELDKLAAATAAAALAIETGIVRLSAEETAPERQPAEAKEDA
ncbi:MAG: DUF3772 domain-containing protein [Methylocystis sp.]